MTTLPILQAGGNGAESREISVPAALTRLFRHPVLDWGLMTQTQKQLVAREVRAVWCRQIVELKLGIPKVLKEWCCPVYQWANKCCDGACMPTQQRNTCTKQQRSRCIAISGAVIRNTCNMWLCITTMRINHAAQYSILTSCSDGPANLPCGTSPSGDAR